MTSVDIQSCVHLWILDIEYNVTRTTGEHMLSRDVVLIGQLLDW